MRTKTTIPVATQTTRHPVLNTSTVFLTNYYRSAIRARKTALPFFITVAEELFARGVDVSTLTAGPRCRDAATGKECRDQWEIEAGIVIEGVI